MTNQKYIWPLAAIIAIVAVLFFIRRPSSQAPVSDTASSSTATQTVSVVSNKNLVRPSFQTNDSFVHDSNIPSDIMARYRQGQISKGEAMQEASVAKNKSMDVYGKVIDQYGQPVAGAKVQGALGITLGFMSEKVEYYSTETDTNGRFSFLGLNGSSLGIWPQKEGYFYNLKLPSQRPDNYQTAPNNPVVFNIWKLNGAEPLVGQTIDAKIPHDGTPIIFDIATGKESPSGNLLVTLMRFPRQIKPGLIHPYNWQFKIEMLHGGLIEESDPYPYWAPNSGYQPAFEFEISSNSVPWQSQLEQNFYIKTAQGQYGRMYFDISTALTPARMHIDITINPSGAQNLEPSQFPQ